jgi:group I intron endonuclease
MENGSEKVCESYGYVYKIENLVNNKIYIGQTTQIPTKRKHHHFWVLGKNNHNNPHLQRAYNKYGINSFKFSIINTYPSKKELDKGEIYYINKYDALCRNKGYNLMSGGSHGKPSQETREKMSKNSGVKSPEVRKKIGESVKGDKHPMYGKHHTLTSKKLMSKNAAMRNPKHRKKLLNTLKGRGKFGFSGAHYKKDRNAEKKPWQCVITYNRIKKSLGYFKDPLTCEILKELVLKEIYAWY